MITHTLITRDTTGYRVIAPISLKGGLYENAFTPSKKPAPADGKKVPEQPDLGPGSGCNHKADTVPADAPASEECA